MRPLIIEIVYTNNEGEWTIKVPAFYDGVIVLDSSKFDLYHGKKKSQLAIHSYYKTGYKSELTNPSRYIVYYTCFPCTPPCG